MKKWLVSFAVFAAIATAPMSASAQHIIQIPGAGEPQDEASPPPRERVFEDQQPPAAPGCTISTMEDETPLGKRTITRTVCH